MEISIPLQVRDSTHRNPSSRHLPPAAVDIEKSSLRQQIAYASSQRSSTKPDPAIQGTGCRIQWIIAGDRGFGSSHPPTVAAKGPLDATTTIHWFVISDLGLGAWAWACCGLEQVEHPLASVATSTFSRRSFPALGNKEVVSGEIKRERKKKRRTYTRRYPTC